MENAGHNDTITLQTIHKLAPVSAACFSFGLFYGMAMRQPFLKRRCDIMAHPVRRSRHSAPVIYVCTSPSASVSASSIELIPRNTERARQKFPILTRPLDRFKKREFQHTFPLFRFVRNATYKVPFSAALIISSLA